MTNASPEWLQEISLPKICGDGASEKIGEIVVTALPWLVVGNDVEV